MIYIGLTAGVACSGGSSTGPDDSQGQFYIRAKVDGANWSSTAGSETAGVTYSSPGLFVLYGAQVGGSNPYVIAITLANIRGPGTYQLGVGPSVPGGSAIISNQGGGWATEQSGVAGTITITALSATQIEGTFEFTATANSGSASGSRTVTAGQFVLQVKTSGTVATLPDNAGSVVKATIGGAAWYAAAVSTVYTSSNGGTLSIAAQNSIGGISVTIVGVAAPGTFQLTPSSSNRTFGYSRAVNSLSNIWSSLGAGGNMTVTVTSLTATRIQGTFSGTLGPAPGTQTTGTLAIANGTFDVGRQF